MENDLELSKKESQRCARFVQRILNFARANSPSYRRFDLAAPVDQTMVLLGHRFKAKDISVTKHLDGCLEIDGGPNQASASAG